jgi:hypothetical protein
MVDVEDAVRDALRAPSERSTPSDQVWADVQRRIRRRKRRRRVVVGGAAFAMLGAATTIASTAGGDGDAERSQVIAAGPGPVTTVGPETTDPSQIEAEWNEIEPPSIEAREGASVTPAGDKVIMWGGAPFGRDAPTDSNTGLAFYPTPLQWAGIADAPFGTRIDHVAVWTGTELIVWGGKPTGETAGTGYAVDGAAYNPTTAAWRAIAPAPLPPDRYSGVWTGTELVVIGGGEATVTGAAYNPTTDTWRLIAPPPVALVGFHEAVHRGDVIVVGAERTGEATAQQFRVLSYDPTIDAWTDLGGQSIASVDVGIAVSGDRLVVWGDDERDPTWQLDLTSGAWTGTESFPAGCEVIGPAVGVPGAVVTQRCDVVLRYNLATGVWFDVDVPTDRWIVIGDQVLMPA